MLVSTRGRYALRAVIDLAEHDAGAAIPLRDVADRQQTSLKYMERIMAELSRAGLVTGQHGKGGGYRLARAPETISAGEVLRHMEGSLAPVACLSCDAAPCDRSGECRTLPMWRELDRRIEEYLDSVTIAALMRGDVEV